jgi:hypothetical protein
MQLGAVGTMKHLQVCNCFTACKPMPPVERMYWPMAIRCAAQRMPDRLSDRSNKARVSTGDRAVPQTISQALSNSLDRADDLAQAARGRQHVLPVCWQRGAVAVVAWVDDNEHIRRPMIQVDIDHELVGISVSAPFEGPLDVPAHMVEPFYEAYMLYSQVCIRGFWLLWHGCLLTESIAWFVSTT